VDALESDEVLVHPFVIGELACGMLGNRNEVLSLLSALPPAVVASDDEVLGFIAERKHLLASVALTPEAQLWTRDKRLRAVAESLRLALPTAS